MRYLVALISILFLFGCSDNSTKSAEDNLESILENGKWVLESIEEPLEQMKHGIKFSKDKQVFYIDSQGRVIPTISEIVYKVKNDTLRIVDFKYEAKRIYEKGTLVTIIKNIDNDRIELEVIHPQKNSIVLVKEKL